MSDSHSVSSEHDSECDSNSSKKETKSSPAPDEENESPNNEDLENEVRKQSYSKLSSLIEGMGTMKVNDSGNVSPTSDTQPSPIKSPSTTSPRQSQGEPSPIRAKLPVLPAPPAVDRKRGNVLEFKSRNGFGFIMPVEKPSEKVFVHWKEIQTSDRWPQLKKGQQVEYELREIKGKMQAVDVTAPGGGKLVCGQDDVKEFNEEKTYTGTVKFFDVKKGYGFITPNEKITWRGKTVDKNTDIYVPREEIITDDEPPALNKGSVVEFSIYVDRIGLGAGRVCNPGGEKIVYNRRRNTNHSKSSVTSHQSPGAHFGYGFSQEQANNHSSVVANGVPVHVPGMEQMRQYNAMNQMMAAPYANPANWGMAPHIPVPSRGWDHGFRPQSPMPNPRHQMAGMKNVTNMVHQPGVASPNNQQNNSQMIEVGLHVENKYVGGLIGKKGEVASQMRQETGARIQFGDARLGRGADARRVLSVIGPQEAVTQAFIKVGKKIAEIAQIHEQKLVFLIPDAYCGIFIGKGGAFLKKVRELGVKVTVSDNPVALPAASMVSTASIVGSEEKVAQAVKLVVPKLGQISKRVRQDAMEFVLTSGQTNPQAYMTHMPHPMQPPPPPVGGPHYSNPYFY